VSLERKDVRASLDADLHGILKDICEHEGITTAEFIERLLVPVLERRYHDTMKLARRFQRSGYSRSQSELSLDQGDRR
jgi:hypothetical protein